jgi:hypothetical protein
VQEMVKMFLNLNRIMVIGAFLLRPNIYHDGMHYFAIGSSSLLGCSESW